MTVLTHFNAVAVQEYIYLQKAILSAPESEQHSFCLYLFQDLVQCQKNCTELVMLTRVPDMGFADVRGNKGSCVLKAESNSVFTGSLNFTRGIDYLEASMCLS